MRNLLFVAATLAMGCPSTTSNDASGGSDTPTIDAPGLDAPSLDVPGLDAPGSDTPGADVPGLDTPGLDAPGGRCTMNSECAIRAESCCGNCGAATSDDFIALHRDDVAGYDARVCVGIPCPECARPDDPMLVAACEAQRCVGHNLAVERYTECTTSADCTLGPRQCCDCGLLGEFDVIAYNPARGSPYDLICDTGTICPPCVPTYMSGVAAGCAGGRCLVFGPD